MTRRSRVQRIAERDGIACWLCGRPVDLSLRVTNKKHATADHVVPVSRGGVNALSNLRLAHSDCNNRRGNRDAPEEKPVLKPVAESYPLPFLWPRGKNVR